VNKDNINFFVFIRMNKKTINDNIFGPQYKFILPNINMNFECDPQVEKGWVRLVYSITDKYIL